MKTSISKYFRILSLFLIVLSCNKEKFKEKSTKKKPKTNFNFLICPDLSNRLDTTLYKKPVDDIKLIQSIFDVYFPKIYLFGNRLVGQEDKISIIFPNKENVLDYNIDSKRLRIDLSNFHNKNRKKYLESKDLNESYKSDTRNIIKELKNIYHKSREKSSGVNLFQFFKSIKINNTPSKRNILILFTDGYIEYDLKDKRYNKENKSYFLYSENIKEFRNAFFRSKEKNINTFFKKNNYGLIPIENSNLENLEILVVEIYDRSVLNAGNKEKIVSDFEIIDMFWSDWLTKSKVKYFEVHSYTTDEDKFKEILINFINTEN